MSGHELFRETDYVDICLYINPFPTKKCTFHISIRVYSIEIKMVNIFLIFEQSLTDWIDENEREHKSQFSSCQINRT